MGQIQEVAARFGVDWVHLVAQSISFGIVCVALYKLAYTPILKVLEARRQQIASGLANAEKIQAELARIEARRASLPHDGRREDTGADDDSGGERETLYERGGCGAVVVEDRSYTTGEPARR